MIKSRWSLVILIFILVAILITCEVLRICFTSSSKDSEDEDLAKYWPSMLHIRRKLLALDLNVNEELLELKSGVIPFNKNKSNKEENLRGISKRLISDKSFGRNRMKKLSRRKRNVRRTDFGWKLSLNVSNNKNPLKGNESISKSGKEKFLNMAVQMEGASPDDSFKELHKAWDSLGLLLRKLYGKNARDVQIKSSTEGDNVPTETRTEKSDRDRTPKFLFGLINFGSSGNSSLEEVVTSPEIGDGSASVAPEEELISTKVPSSVNSTVVPVEIFRLPETTVESTVVPVTETFMGFENTSPEFNTKFVEAFQKNSDAPDVGFPNEMTTVKPEQSFTSEQLKDFCISLLSRIHVSPKSAGAFSDEDGSGDLAMTSTGDKNTMTEFQSLSTDIPKESTTKSSNQRFGIWASIWNRFVGRRMIQHSIDDNLESTLTPKNDATFVKEDSTNDVLGLTGENSTVLGVPDSTESDKDVFNDEDGSVLTVPNCENFFREMQNDAVFSKPNLLDIINNPILFSLDPSNFNFTEILDDKQERSMRSGTDTTDSNFQNDNLFTERVTNSLNTPLLDVKSTTKEPKFSVNELFREHTNLSEFTVSNQGPLPTIRPIDDQESFQSGSFDESNIDNLVTENENNLLKAATEIEFISDKFTTIQFQSSTEILDDGLFFEPHIQAKTDKSSETPSSEISVDLDDRIFGLFNFGSGERSLNESDSSSEQDVSEFPEDRSFQPDLANFASGDSDLNEAFSVDGLETTSTDSVTRPNIFDLIFNLRREENRMNSTESVAFGVNEKNQVTEGGTRVFYVEKSDIVFKFDLDEKYTEHQDLTNIPATQSISDDNTSSQNAFDNIPVDTMDRMLTNIPATQSTSDDHAPSQNTFDEKSIEFQSDLKEQFTENQNVAMDLTESLSEDQTSFQIVIEDVSGDDGSRIFPGLLSVFGSGDGRELSEGTTDLYSTSEFPECLDCFKNENDSYSLDYYDDCGSDINDTVPFISEKVPTTINPLSNDNMPDVSVDVDGINLNNKTHQFFESNQDQSQLATIHSRDSIDSTPEAEIIDYERHDNSGSIDYDTTTIEPPTHIHIEGECDESHFVTETEAFSASPTGAITSLDDNPRLLDTFFLTGSGAGGLFGNDNGEINLVQEPDTTSFPSPVTPRQSRRGGRMDDVSFVTWPPSNEQVFEKQPQSTHDGPKLNLHDENIDQKFMQTPEEVAISPLTTHGSDQSAEDSFNNLKIAGDGSQIFQDVSSQTVTAINTPVSPNVVPKKKANDMPPRYCSNAGECNIALNEGCITKKGHGICDCRRSFVRHPETDICEAPFMLKTSLKLPSEAFHEDLKDKYSERYQNKARDAIDTMWLVVYQDPTLEYNLADIDVAGFEKGSLVVHWKLIFAMTKNESISETVQEFEVKLEENFKREDVLKSAPLNVKNATLLSFSDINACEAKELNYCSPNADCIRDEFGGFSCRCKEGFTDVSTYRMYPGETCIVVCPPNYCGENGYCEVRSNGEKQCLCNGLYFGEKCNISGIFVISCFAVANAILIIIVLATVFFVKRRRRRGRFYERNQIMFQPNRAIGPFGQVSPRMAASIALDEMGPTKTSKYLAMSTPSCVLVKPDIQITSPSIIGSSISYDFDSTFNTPSAELNMNTETDCESNQEIPKYASVPNV